MFTVFLEIGPESIDNDGYVYKFVHVYVSMKLFITIT